MQELNMNIYFVGNDNELGITLQSTKWCSPLLSFVFVFSTFLCWIMYLTPLSMMFPLLTTCFSFVLAAPVTLSFGTKNYIWHHLISSLYLQCTIFSLSSIPCGTPTPPTKPASVKTLKKIVFSIDNNNNLNSETRVWLRPHMDIKTEHGCHFHFLCLLFIFLCFCFYFLFSSVSVW